ncbi:hypothetical protein ACTXMB_14600 [Arthrobacter rhombi]|uniref:hypothetical protein n=1 Tax=Arthrobacter rhombi TaxID=71253 RepID=UPI003FD34975
MTEKPNEKYARDLVSKALGVPVDRYEDGSAPSQVDALIRFPDQDAALEIVADHDSEFNAQWAALERIGHNLSIHGLAGKWWVELARSAQIRKIQRKLPDLLLSAKDSGILSGGLRGRELPSAFSAIGVKSVQPMSGGPDETVYLHVEGWSGSASGSPNVLARWIEQVLAGQSDVAAKLDAHPAAEKHAFIWATIGSSYSVQFQLENRDQALPVDAPSLPVGVTHIWVAGSFLSQGFLAWFPDRGWWKESLL